MSSVYDVEHQFRINQLPEHVFLKITEELSVDDLLNLDTSRTLVDGTASRCRARELIELAFSNIKVFRMNNIKSTNYDYDHLAKTLLRCGKKLEQFSFMSTAGVRLTLDVLQGSATLMSKLAQQCPNICVFERCLWKYGQKFIVQYVDALEELNLVSKLEDIDLDEDWCLAESKAVVNKAPLLQVLSFSCDSNVVFTINEVITLLNRIIKIDVKNGIGDNEFKQQLLVLTKKCTKLETLSLGFSCDVIETVEDGSDLFGDVEYCREIVKRHAKLKYHLDIDMVGIRTVVSIFGTELVQKLDLFIVIINGVEPYMLEELKKFDKLKYMNIDTDDWTILEVVSDLKNFPELVDIKFNGRQLKNNDQLLIMFIENRGHLLSRLTTSLVKDHRQLVSTMVAYCSKLLKVRIVLDHTDETLTLKEVDVTRLKQLNCDRYIHLECMNKFYFEELISYKNNNCDKLLFSLIKA